MVGATALGTIGSGALLFDKRLGAGGHRLFRRVTPCGIPSVISTRVIIGTLTELEGSAKGSRLECGGILNRAVRDRIGTNSVGSCSRGHTMRGGCRDAVGETIHSLLRGNRFDLGSYETLCARIACRSRTGRNRTHSTCHRQILNRSLVRARLRCRTFHLSDSITNVGLIRGSGSRRVASLRGSLIRCLRGTSTSILNCTETPGVTIVRR